MTTLDAAKNDKAIPTLSATLSLLGMVMKSVPKTVLIKQFGQDSQIFIEILEEYSSGENENFLIIRHVRIIFSFSKNLSNYFRLFLFYFSVLDACHFY